MGWHDVFLEDKFKHPRRYRKNQLINKIASFIKKEAKYLTHAK